MSNQTSLYRPERDTSWQRGVQPPGTTGVPNQTSSFPKRARALIPFRQINITSGPAQVGDSFDIQTGVFDIAGAQTIVAGFGLPILPDNEADFINDNRVKIWRNGNLQSKGPGADVEYVSETQISFTAVIKPFDEILVESVKTFV